ncbi:MAG: hypothetical protein HUU50_16180 [Candidatus Brocadiae bacterium]|nr:hypothetical protein [Candidatus Brocadiia bacterium]
MKEIVFKNIFCKNFVFFLITISIYVILLHFIPILYSYRHFLVIAGLFFAISANLYSIQKGFVLFGYRRWKKNFSQNAENLLKAQKEFENREAIVENGIILNQRQRALAGDDILDQFSLLEEYQTRIDGRHLTIERRYTFACMESWRIFHIYCGLLAIGLCLSYLAFLPVYSFISQILLLYLIGILFTGLCVIVFSRLCQSSQKISLEYIEYLEKKQWKSIEQIARNGSYAFSKSLREMILLLKQNTTTEKLFQYIQNAKKMLTPEDTQLLDMAFAILCQWHRIVLLLKPFQKYRICKRIFVYLHIPFAISFLVFCLLYILGLLYYGKQ